MRYQRWPMRALCSSLTSPSCKKKSSKQLQPSSLSSWMYSSRKAARIVIMRLFRPLRLVLWINRQRAVFRSRSITLQIVSQMEVQNRVKFELHVAANPTTSINWKATLSLPSQNLRLKLKTAQVIKKKWIWKTSYQPTDPDFRKMRNPSSKKIFWTSEMSRSRLCLGRWSKNWLLRSTREFSNACNRDQKNFTELPGDKSLTRFCS